MEERTPTPPLPLYGGGGLGSPVPGPYLHNLERGGLRTSPQPSPVEGEGVRQILLISPLGQEAS